MLRFIHERTSKQLSLGISVEPHYWDKDAEMVTADCPDRAALQSQIDSTLATYRKKIQRLEALDMEVDFTNLFDQTSKCTPQFVDNYFQQQITAMKQAGKINTAIKYTATRTSLIKFHPTKLRFEEIDGKFLRNFEAFLHSACNQSNSIATKFSVLKAVYNKALAEGIFTTPHSPFLQFKIGRLWTATRKRAIRKEEVQRLMQAEILADGSAYLDFARDIFLFSYLSAGINFKDIATLRYCDMDEERIYYARHKTSKEMTCHLSEQSKAIIGKYAKSDHADEGEEKHYNILLRRLRNGQCFRQPVLGNREFSVRKIELVDSFDYSQVSDELMGDEDLGIMLYKMNFRDGGKPLNGNWDKPVFSDAADAVYYHPHIVNGVIDVKKYREEGLKC